MRSFNNNFLFQAYKTKILISEINNRYLDDSTKQEVKL